MKTATQLRLLGIYCKAQLLRGVDAPGRAALKAFVRPPKPRITSKQQTFLDTARRSTLDFEGVAIALYEWGDPGAPYIFSAYGYAYSAGRWRHFAPQLVEAGYRFVALDYHGHGQSGYGECDYPTMVRLLEAALRHFGQPELVLAHSFGAGITTDMLSRLERELHPKRVALLAGFSDARYIFRQFARSIGFGEILFASLERAIQRRTGQALGSFDPALRSRSLGHISALIAHDPQDQVTSFSNAERLARYWPGSHLYTAKEAGHGFTDGAAAQKVIAWLLTGQVPPGAVQLNDMGIVDAALEHELSHWLRPVEIDGVHAGFRSEFFGG